MASIPQDGKGSHEGAGHRQQEVAIGPQGHQVVEADGRVEAVGGDDPAGDGRLGPRATNSHGLGPLEQRRRADDQCRGRGEEKTVKAPAVEHLRLLVENFLAARGTIDTRCQDEQEQHATGLHDPPLPAAELGTLPPVTP
jgi:hypothetical protein